MSTSTLSAKDKAEDLRALEIFQKDSFSSDRTACLNHADDLKGNAQVDFAPSQLGRLTGITFSTQSGAVHTQSLKILHDFVQGNTLKLCKLFGALPGIEHTLLRVEGDLKTISDRLEGFHLGKESQFDATKLQSDLTDYKNRVIATETLENELVDLKARVVGVVLEPGQEGTTPSPGLESQVTSLRSDTSSLQGTIFGAGTDPDELGLVEEFKDIRAAVASIRKHTDSLKTELGPDLPRRLKQSTDDIATLQSGQTRHVGRLANCEEAIDLIKPQLASKASKEELEAAASAALDGGVAVHKALGGANKPPILRSMEQTEFRAFRHQFVIHSKVHRWSPEVSKQQLMLSLHSSIHAPLTMAIPAQDVASITTEEILVLWDERICPEALRSLAITQLSNLKQDLHETDLNYLTRGQQLYMRARKTDNLDDPETDSRFVVDLIQGLRDKRKIPHIRREEPQTITALRTLINKENVINELDSTLDSTLAHIGSAASPSKPGNSKGCDACHDTSHNFNNCPRIAAFAKRTIADQKNHSKQLAEQAALKKQKADKDKNNSGGNRSGSGGRGRGKRRRGKDSYGEDKDARPFKQEKVDYAKN
jgi:hypothetical protein